MSWKIRFGLALVVTLLIATQGQCQNDPKSIVKMAQAAAPGLKDYIVAKQGNAKFDVAVFAFGNEEGAAPPSFGSMGKIIQGELIYALNRQASATSGDLFNVLSMAQLKARFANLESSVVDEMSAGSPTRIAEIMSMATPPVDMIILGSIDARNYTSFVSTGRESVPLTIRAYSSDGTAKTLNDRVDPGELGQLGGLGSEQDQSNFKVSVIVNGQPRELVRGEENTTWQRVYFLELKEEDRHKKYSVRIENKPPTSSSPATEWAVALLVDGVNSIYQKTGRLVNNKEEFGPVIRHPDQCYKWAISPPGKYFQGNQLKDSGPGDPDHSVREVTGFQVSTGSQGAGKFFQLADKGGSIATSLGIRNDVGIIEIHAYPKQNSHIVSAEFMGGLNRGTRVSLPSAESYAADEPGETTTGDDFSQATQDVHIPLTGIGEVWRIHYYYKGQPPTEDGVPIVPTN